MMSNQFQLAQKLIQKTKDIFIIPSKIGEEESISNALALFYSLKKIGKNVNLLVDKIPSKIKFLTSLFQQEIVVSIDMNMKEISEMRYEKDIRQLKIYLSIKSGNINNQDISLIRHKLNVERKILRKEVCLNNQPILLIAIGRSNPEEITLFYRNRDIVFENHKSESINNNFEKYFNKVSLDESNTSLAEMLVKIIKMIGPEIIDKNIATCLLAGLILKTKNFHYSRISPQYFAFANSLIEKGADYKEIAQKLYFTENDILREVGQNRKTSEDRLFDCIFKKLKFQKEQNFCFASLSSQDFEESQSTPKDLIFVIQRLRQDILPSHSWLLLWETCSDCKIVQGVFWSKNKDMLNKILDKFSGKVKGNGILFSIQEEIEQVQAKIFELLNFNLKMITKK
ncbi:MAG: hypothetical protein HF967_06885 [Methanosarcinales archaeon]|nr:hypothetical protein [Methanosarcinales archaeon]